MKKTKLLGVLVGLLMLNACAGKATRYTVELDPSLSPEMAEAAIDAAQDWTAKVDGQLSFNVVSTKCKLGDSTPNLIQIVSYNGAAPSGSEVAGREAGDGNWSLIQVFPDALSGATQADMQRLMAHEIGHALQLQHSGAGSVMCANSACAAMTVQDADVAQWESL